MATFLWVLLVCCEAWKTILKMDYQKSSAALFGMRKDIVRMYRKGMDVMEIAETKGICWKTEHTAIDRYAAEST